MNSEKEKLILFIKQNQPILSQEQALAIAEFFEEKTIKKGEIFLSEGQISNEYYYLETGCARSHTINIEGEDVTTGLYSSNTIVCELMSFFMRIPAQENYQTLCDSKLWYVTFETLQKAFHSLPAFREFGRALLVNEYGKLKLRTLSTLHQTAEERYANLLKSSPDIFQHAPLKNIASYLGITDTSLSRIRKDFAKR
ncbi:Crp/Fnr family transcriptional regulator [Aurantibacillus circumpalustris]|uniref:Crp/Fnr family transcriptional regulator n=1 Tax=Aurantibacillus circumpalustris TaxID=3036359 RepID=UPI00295B94AF|nr:Crp/Fnr family transcriptional regulator [Aurantibacillus circumpalustris]